jgi:hypothetical protein
MTATLDEVGKKKEPPPERAELQAGRELVRQAKEQGLSLTGPEGLLKQLTHISGSVNRLREERSGGDTDLPISRTVRIRGTRQNARPE